MPKKFVRYTVAIAFALALLPATAKANSISPMTFLFCSRLLFGNFLLGLLEGLIVAWILKAPKKRAVWIMILANYGSMFGGLVLIDVVGAAIAYGLLLNNALYNAMKVISILPVLAFVMTALMELPFCQWIKGAGSWQTVKATLAAQIVSYVLILPFYYSTSNIGLYNNAKVERTPSFAKNPNAWIYYVSPQDGFVYQCRTDGTQKSRIYDKESLGHSGLFIWPDGKRLELWYYTDSWKSEENRKQLLEDLSWNGSLPVWYRISQYRMRSDSEWHDVLTNPQLEHLWKPDAKYEEDRSAIYYQQTNDEVAYYQPIGGANWYVSVSSLVFLGEGLMGRHPDGRTFDISLNTPYVTWGCSNATVLPSNQVVCQLGPDQVVLLDLESRQIALIANGHSPVVVFDKYPEQ